MPKDYKKEVIELIKEHEKQGFEFGKPLSYLKMRVKTSKEEMVNEIINCKKLEFVEKQSRDNEIRYVLYFIYNGKGRTYVVRFKEKIRLISAFPLGRTTIRRYKKAKFKK